MKILTAISLGLAVAVTGLLLVLPTYSGWSSESPFVQQHATLLQVNGPRALIALAIPVLIALVPVLLPRWWVRLAAGIVLAAFVGVAGFSIGLFYAAIMLMAGLLSVPFADHPQQAAPPLVLIRLLAALAADPHNCLALSSGRQTENLDQWFGAIEGMWLVAEHGAELRPPGCFSWEALRSQAPTNWKPTVMPILEHFVDRTPGSFVEEKKYSVVWHYRLAEPEFGSWLANELVSMLEAMLADTELRAFRGEKVVEVRPLWANKGEALERLLAAQPAPDFLFAAGDDRTDEDLFERMPCGSWTVHVGSGLTSAAFVLPDFESIRRLLVMFVETVPQVRLWTVARGSVSG